MSLINDALKKAQRTRSGDASGTMPPMPGGGAPVTKRAQPRTAQQLVLIAAGALVLVVLSVVITVYLINRSPDPKLATPPKLAAPTPTAASAPTPLVVAPVFNPPVLTTRPPAEAAPVVAQTPTTEKSAPPAPSPETKPATAATVPVAQMPTPAPTSEPTPPASRSASNPVVTTPPPPSERPDTPSPAALPAKPDERVSLFVDAIRVAGIRPSGNESRVLMNDRVFRVNEIVERNFGLRLTKVEANSLTFTDANGAIYVKNF